MDTTRTTTGLISLTRQKLVTALEPYSLSQIASFLVLTFLAGILSSVLISLDGTVSLTLWVLRWNNLALPKIILAFALVFQRNRIIRLYKSLRLQFLPKRAVKDSIEGIPTVELLDHLFTSKTFKRDEVETKFCVPRYRVTELTAHLKRVGILTHGENNMSVLNESFSRQDVATILRGKQNAKDLEPLFRRREDHFTSEPSAKEIRERVSASLPRPSGFQIRVLAS